MFIATRSKLTRTINRSCARRLVSGKPAQSGSHILPKSSTWSLSELLSQGSNDSASAPTVTPSELHHLLRLSALPHPKSPKEEQKMLNDLQSQLHFVRAIQSVDIPDDVEPLQSIRDETEEAMKEQEYTVDRLADEFAKEEVVGKRGRIRKRKVMIVEDKAREGRDQDWDPLKLAPRTIGRYIAVDTAKD